MDMMCDEESDEEFEAMVSRIQLQKKHGDSDDEDSDDTTGTCWNSMDCSLERWQKSHRH